MDNILRDDLISRKEAIKLIEDMLDKPSIKANPDTANGLIGAHKIIWDMPSAMDMKQKPSVASWIKTEGEINAVGDWGKVYKCSCCNKTTRYPEKFCPNCGAEMYYGEQ